MKKTILLLMLAGLAAAAADETDLGPTVLMRGSGQMQSQSGITIRFAAYALPGGKAAQKYGNGGIIDGVNAIHRYMADEATHTMAGYDLAIVGDAAHGYFASFRPLTNAQDDYDVGHPWRVIVPKFPPLTPVKDGDTLFLELMASDDGTQKIVDYMQILLTTPEPAAAATKAEARDYTVDDGAVTFDMSRMTMWIDGKKWTGVAGSSTKPGATFWIVIPGAGRYALSLIPHGGTWKGGTVRDNVIAFQDGGHSYEVRLMSPIAGAGKAWNLYMAHDTSYMPRADMAKAISCGVDRYENLVSGH